MPVYPQSLAPLDEAQSALYRLHSCLKKKNVKVNTVRMSHAESSEEHTGVRVPAGPGFSIRIRTLLGASVK